MTAINKTKNRTVLAYELVGTFFIVILGTVLHFTFEWAGGQPAVGVFSAVNESVWEHLKLAFWPALLLMLIEYTPLKKRVANFFFAKTVGVYLMIIIIPIVFYAYTAITGESILAVDITTFIVAIVFGQLLSYKLFSHRGFPERLKWVSLTAFAALGIAFILFTFYPPHVPLFRDPISGNYGIP